MTWFFDLDWGSVPAWVAAFGSAGAFGIALYLFWQSLNDRKLAQARLVSAWVVQLTYTRMLVEQKTHRVQTGYPVVTDMRRGKSGQLGMASSFLIRGKTHLVDFVIQNSSEEIITDVSFRIFRKQGSQFFSTSIRELPAQHSYEDYALLPAIDKEGNEILRHTRGLKVQLIFTDASGRRWERVTGKPVQFRKKRDLAGSNLKWEHALGPSPEREPIVGPRAGGAPEPQ